MTGYSSNSENTTEMPKDLLNKKTPQNPGNRPQQGLSVWKYIFWFILIWVVISTLNQVFVAPEHASISYSEFKNQVRADNIGSVTLKANTIKGEFRSAYSMVNDRIGPMTYRQGEEHIFFDCEIVQSRDFSEETAGIIDEEVKRIITTMEERSCRLLSANRPMLDSIAEALLE